jgi:hypothetical protein
MLLKQSLADLLGRLETSDIESLTSTIQQLEKECERLRNENRRLQEDARAVAEQPAETQAPTLPAVPLSVGLSAAHIAPTLREFLKAFSRLVRGRASFRNEFLGMTIVSDGEVSAMLSGPAARGVEFLLDTSLSEQEAAARNASLQRTLDELILHYMGLLEGYRTSIDEGMHKMLQKANPDLLRSQLADQSISLGPLRIPYRSIPFLLDGKIMQLTRRAHEELVREDRGVLEKRYFRPAFVKGYEKCIASLRATLSGQHEG